MKSDKNRNENESKADRKWDKNIPEIEIINETTLRKITISWIPHEIAWQRDTTVTGHLQEETNTNPNEDKLLTEIEL